MKVGDLVKGIGLFADHWQLGLVVESAPNVGGTDGHWVQFFEDPDTWKWYNNHERHKVKVISESR